MDVRIGVTYTAKELVVETDESADSVQSTLDAAFAGSSQLLVLTDNRGRRVAVPTDKVAYVEFGGDESNRKVGFGR
jgi:hypothetical protein